jgi:putative ABC transport system substrate-binding protein
MESGESRKNMKRKITVLTLCAMLLALCVSAEAQQATKIPQIGLVVANRETTSARELQQGLRELGYIEGKNILFEYRYTQQNLDRIPSLVSELVQLKVDVIVLSNFRAIRAAKQATQTIPVVMVTTQDPVETGIIDSLARPGGNITGLTRLTRDLSGKRLELLKEAVPKISRVGILWDSRPDIEASGSAIALKEYEEAAHALKLRLQSLEVHGPNPDWEGAFQAASKGRAGALITIHNALIVRYPKRIADLAIKNRLPSMYEGSSYVEAGGLMSYSSNDADQYKRAAVYVDKILKGTKPADLPVEQPTKFEFVINLKTAKALNLTIPQSVLFRADKVIK